MTETGDLVHRITRNAFRDACSDCSTVRPIETAFVNEGFEPAPEEKDWFTDGQRRGTFDRHTALIDWADSSEVRRLLNVFEEILTWATDEHYKAKLVAQLKRDGLGVTEEGRITGTLASTVKNLPLGGLRDAGAIREHLVRIAATSNTDPGVAISGAKALIEATTKLVLTELETTFDERADLPELVKLAQKELSLNRDSVAPTQAGAETIKRILSNLSQLAIGIAELRNLYGPDHGRTTAVTGLFPRHAHLAVGSATTYCTMLLETLEARRAD